MALTINESDKYYINGKIIDINKSRGIFTISVTSPFTCEIKFHCESEHYDILHPPAFKYNWISWVQSSGHPSVSEASAYYNTTDKCFYKKKSGIASEWEAIDFEDIYDDNPNLLNRNRKRHQNQYDFFLNKYVSILQKEQLCEFSAYALHENRSVHNIQVDRRPDEYYWIYDPNTFQAEKWDTKSIDDLVKEIRPSRDCLNQLLESYKADDSEAFKEKFKRIPDTIKSALKRLQDFLTKYDKLTIGLGGLIIGAIAASVAILAYLKK